MYDASCAVMSAVLLVQPANGVGASVCVVVTMTTSATPTPLTSIKSTLASMQSIAPSSPPRSSTGMYMLSHD